MGESLPYFEQAADALSRAMKTSGLAEQERLLDEALRLNRLALAQERRKLRTDARASSAADRRQLISAG
jgi:hypothetical protein